MSDYLLETKFPTTRMRRTRASGWLRRLVQENTLTPDDLIWPLFVVDGENQRQSVELMPGVDRLSIDLLVESISTAVEFGISAIALFPHVDQSLKTPVAYEAVNPDNLVCRAVRAVKEAKLDVGVICDVALDPFNSDGHDGIVLGGEVVNDETIEILCRQAVIQAEAGCDVIAPSDMMDGRVGAIREALDKSGFQNVVIMSYAVKYASGFYGPFRNAVGSDVALIGSKETYQMNPTNSDEALREVALDISEGADMIMVKPGLSYLDVVHRVKKKFEMPTFAYNVSGEYAMVKVASEQGCIDYNKTVMEMLVGFKRAGADGILTYHALDAAQLMKSG
ncbi:MAG: delta-aminolevulinic acid dehydratase [Rhodospirillaceae bacterium TMED8]|nr:porphobilinogen synthase [Magnetovibrio sp.]OUT51603.1 MAG: delta-aminolevulinic acid dehydratase [Rhodospirillaceae bacterium TMED8]|tara:strand:+ start:1845 stop:2852 length:1008 start_codon:yes stop_codon:yes gene_type:complete